jgi:FkbM family methyltransferase
MKFVPRAFSWLRGSASPSYHKSYAQSGEDLILAYLFRWIGIARPTYLDVGAHHPTWLSNTYLFYTEGSSGVCVEPDAECCAEIQKHRKRDICLNVGIGVGGARSLKFYVMTSRTLNTFSREEAERCQNTRNYGPQRIERVIDVPVCSITEIMDGHLPHGVNLVSIDVEGLDYDILREFPFSSYQPEAFCVETVRYQADGSLQKNRDLIQFMQQHGYSIYADTYMNTIFVSRQAASRII